MGKHKEGIRMAKHWSWSSFCKRTAKLFIAKILAKEAHEGMLVKVG